MEQEIIAVKNLMVPLDEYTTVSETATLYEAILALEKTQEEQDITRYQYPHRPILVFDESLLLNRLDLSAFL